LYERLREVLEAKRAKGAADARIEEQAAELRDILVGHKKL